MNTILKNIFKDSLALLAGASLTLAFAPFSFFPIAILAPLLLLTTWQDATPKRAFWRGWLFGAGLFATGVYWIFISVHNFGNASAFFAALITSAFIAVLALFPALNGYLLNRYFPYNNYTRTLCAFPAIWILLEWVRSWLFSGFPWLLLGYSQINSPLRGYAPVLGVYGISLAILASSALLWNAIVKFRQGQYKQLYINLLSFVSIWFVGFILHFIPWTHATGKSVSVSLVQGNIAQSLKWSAEQIQPTLDTYKKLTETHWDSQIIVWPESAIPVPMHAMTDFFGPLSQQAKEHNTTLIAGVPIKAANDGYYNAVITLGAGTGVYTKHRLVPFGEFIPLKKYIGGLLDLLNVPMSDFIASSDKAEPLLAGDLKIATFICYEIAFPEQVLSYGNNIDLILTVSNDAWFGQSIAQAQHVEMAQMRALEIGRPVLFVANDGITAVIDAAGKIQSAAPQYQTYVLTDKVKLTTGKTPWQYLALDPVLLTVLMLLFVAVKRHKS